VCFEVKILWARQDLILKKHTMNEISRAGDTPLMIMRVNPIWVEY